MRLIHLTPVGLSKFLVGDTFKLELSIETDKQIQFQLHTNLNHQQQVVDLNSNSHSPHFYSLNTKLTKSGFFTYHIRYQIHGQKQWHYLENDHGKRITGRIQVDPDWVANAIVYNVFVRFFGGKVKRGDQIIKPGEGGTFDDVKSHLTDLYNMGINTLYFNPIHLIGELYRKYNTLDQLVSYLQPGSPYSIKDYKSIDPELTYDKDTGKHLLSDPAEEFRQLIQSAHEKGMYVIMDLVFNHTAHDFVFQRIRPEWYLYKQNITSITDPYLYPEDIKKSLPWGDPKHTMSPYDHGIWWDDAAQLNWEYAIPPGPNPAPPNTSLKEMWQYFKSIPKYWIRHFGIDGFRCDIAYRVPPKFWKECIAESRAEAHQYHNNLVSDVVFIAEAYTNELDKLQQAGFTAVYGDYSNKLANPQDLKGYLDYIYNLSGNFFPVGSRWFIFPESHDFGRTPQKILGAKAHEKPIEALRANQSRWLLTATLPGVPLIFNGFEKIEWQPINLFSYGAVDWERDIDLRKFIAKINHIRHEHKSLQKGSYTHIGTNQGLHSNSQLFAFIRRYGADILLIIVNMDVHHQAGPATVYLPPEFKEKYTLLDLLTHMTYHRHGQELIVKLGPGESHLFSVTFSPASTS